MCWEELTGLPALVPQQLPHLLGLLPRPAPHQRLQRTGPAPELATVRGDEVGDAVLRKRAVLGRTVNRAWLILIFCTKKIRLD